MYKLCIIVMFVDYKLIIHYLISGLVIISLVMLCYVISVVIMYQLFIDYNYICVLVDSII